jgi:hypothetical protein
MEVWRIWQRVENNRLGDGVIEQEFPSTSFIIREHALVHDFLNRSRITTVVASPLLHSKDGNLWN